MISFLSFPRCVEIPFINELAAAFGSLRQENRLSYERVISKYLTFVRNGSVEASDDASRHPVVIELCVVFN